MNKKDIAGLIFGRLTALEPTALRDASGSIIWKCRCDCGNTAFYSVNRLLRGTTKSCGCLYRESRKTCIKHRKDMVDGTSVSGIAANKTLRSDNSSGHTGVYYNAQRERWYAKITFQKKQRFLGCYDTAAEAIAAREVAVNRLFTPFLQENWDRMTEHSRNKLEQ